MSSAAPIFVVGRYPPPIDGQSLATERLADLLASEYEVREINTQPPQGGALEVERHRLRRTAHFLMQRPRLGRALADAPGATVFWPAVSPDQLGHLRDLLVTMPSFRIDQRVYAVVHRGNFHQLFERASTRFTARRLVKQLKGFVFNSEHLSQRCSEWIPRRKRFAIPNTISDEIIFEDAEVTEKQRQRSNRQRISVLFLSHMIRSKGYLDALEAVVLMQKEGVPVDAHFVGGWQDEKDRAEFFDRARAGGVQDAVVHHGAIKDRIRIKELYRAADLFLLPTYYRNEAQPLVIIEALNAGTPVIATAHASIPEMIRDGRDGLIVPPKDPASIAQAALRLNDADEWRRFSIEARRRYADVFSPAIALKNWQELIRHT